MRSSFKVVRVDNDRVFIVDLDIGMSVTNDAENVRQHINERYPGRRLIYRDTMGNWDEIVSNDNWPFKYYDEYIPDGV